MKVHKMHRLQEYTSENSDWAIFTSKTQWDRSQHWAKPLWYSHLLASTILKTHKSSQI